MKTSGFNIENTVLAHIKRISKLLALVLVRFARVCKAGIGLDGPQPVKIETHGVGAESLFKYDLNPNANMLYSRHIGRFSPYCRFLLRA